MLGGYVGGSSSALPLRDDARKSEVPEDRQGLGRASAEEGKEKRSAGRHKAEEE